MESAGVGAPQILLEEVVLILISQRPSPFTFTLPQTPRKGKEADHETRQEAHPQAEDPARASGPRPGELAGREAESKRRADHSEQVPRHDPRHPATGRMSFAGRSSSMKEQPHICPLCGRAYDEPPALSRADNQTDICPRCGMMEALAAMPRRETPQERTRRAVYATGNRWAIENFEATHH